ncbi:MAG: hypothetical protein ACRDMJ_02645 [Solirubrobacteraceae bacterium]
MARHASGSVSPAAAQEQLRAAHQAREMSVRSAASPTGLILAMSFLCGALTLAPAHRGSGAIVSIIAVVWFVAELGWMSARNHWRPLRSLPRPRWSFTEAMLISVAVLVGGLVGPHLLAGPSNAPLASWGLAGAVAVTVATLLFAAKASFRRRALRA